jgi:hypothetical protein
MIKIKKAVYVAMLAVAVAALTIPLVGMKVSASGSKTAPSAFAKPNASRVVGPPATAAASQVSAVSEDAAVGNAQSDSARGKISPDVIKALGIKRLPKGVTSKDVAAMLSKKITAGNPEALVRTGLPPGTGPGGASPVPVPNGPKVGAQGPPLVGQPLVLNELSALSASLITTIGGRDNQFSEVALIADWDGREDCAADRGAKIDDFSTVEPDIDFSLTRAAISEHTFANGHGFNSYYYGDSIGNVYFGFDLVGTPLVDAVFQANLPAIVNTPGGAGGFFILNPTAGDCMDDQVTVTGIAVNPVADLGDFNAALCGVTGEVIYVSVFDAEGCASNAANNPIRTRIFEFGVFEIGGTEFILGGVRQILRSRFANTAGITVDDDGSLYYQLVDLIQFTGGSIFKATEICRTVATCGGTPRINRVINIIPDPPSLNSWVGSAANPIVTANGVRNTNYGGGVSGTFGNAVSLAAGPCNVIYAAIARSLVGTDDLFTQNTEGRFPAPGAFTAGTPSMIISFADCSGGGNFDLCSGQALVPKGGVLDHLVDIGGTIPVADGIADAATAGTTTVTPGVNNFRVFAQGNGPDLAPAVGGTAIVPGTPSGLLKVDMQIDYTLHSGLAVSEEGTVFVISGGTPAGIGTNPSPLLGEILCFEDMCPMDRRADFVDLRGNTLPNPPASGGNVGDGDSDRFDHIFYQSPLDQVTLTPGGLAGLSRGFLRYTWRLAPSPLGPGVTLGVTKTRQGDDDTDGPIIFENLDPGHQVAGGDDQNTPFRGDDDNGAGSPALVGALSGGFEFVFGGPVGTAGCVWNAFFLNSNGNITFGEGDTNNSPFVTEFRQGLPKIAPAWADLNPSACDVDLRNFPVQAIGFANVNAFRIRWINVPEFGSEVCTGAGGGFSNTFSLTLYDDGTGIDENSNKLLDPADPTGDNVDPAFDLQEGPTDLRFTREPNTQVLVGCPPRPAGSGVFLFEFCRMDLLGTDARPVLSGFSIGGLDPLNPPGLCETNLSEAARAAETTFGVLVGNQTAAIGCNCLIGEGTEPTIFELFNEGRDPSVGSGGETTFATPDFDLRFEGNDPALCTSVRQRDLNRGKVGFLGIGCAPPAPEICQTVVPSPFVTTPTTTGLVNALCAVQLNIVGCGFFPNEVTTVCQGFQSETGVPLQRAGKTVTTAATLACDTNGDGVADTVVALVNVTPVSCNLLRATVPTSASFGTTPSSGFPAACCGGAGTITITTTFTAGDNNAFGPFTRTVTCALALGTRAPVVISVTPSNGNCAVTQDVLITGACFIINGVPSVTSVFAVDRANAATRINATNFFIVNANVIDALFNFGSVNNGRTFLIFVTGPGGTSRNLTTAVTGSPAGCPLGNEQGVQVTFTCNSATTPPGGTAPGVASITSCKLNRDPSGVASLDVIGTDFKDHATVTLGGVSPKKIKFKDVVPGSTGTFTRITLKKKICKSLPGVIVVTNPGVAASAPFQCTETCN